MLLCVFPAKLCGRIKTWVPAVAVCVQVFLSGFQSRPNGGRGRPIECTALYQCMSSHVHVCGVYTCQPEASVLNSLSMCDESSGWEKSGALRGLSWPLTNWILKRLSICQGLNSYFALPRSGLSYLFGFESPSLHRPLCLPLFLPLYLNSHDAECERERCSKRVRQIKKREHPPLVRLSS